MDSTTTVPKPRGRGNSMAANMDWSSQNRINKTCVRRSRLGTEFAYKRSRATTKISYNKRKEPKIKQNISQILAEQTERIINSRQNHSDKNYNCVENDNQTTVSEDTYKTKNTSQGKYASQRILSRIDLSRKMYETQCEFKKRIRAVPLRRISSSMKRFSSNCSFDLSVEDNESRIETTCM